MVGASVAWQLGRRRRIHLVHTPDPEPIPLVPRHGGLFSVGFVWASMSVLVPLVFVGVSAEWLLVFAIGTPALMALSKSKSIAGGPNKDGGDGSFTFGQRLAYRVDYSFSVVPYIKAITLMILTAGLILSSGFAIYVTSEDSLAESLWEATAGVGLDWTFVGDDDSTSYRVRLIGVLTNIGGLVVTALLLGIVSDSVSMYLDSLRKGSCRVVEENFTLIIGWSKRTIPIIEQITKANISEDGGVVVILAERSKEEMEAEIAANESKIMALGTRVVCRSGSALMLSDLRKVSVSNAKSIVVLADPTVSEGQSDIRSIRILLGLMSALGFSGEGKKESSKLKVTVECCHAENAPLMRTVSPDIIEPVIANSVIGRLLVHAARQPEVISVWETLLGFDDCEFYFKHWQALENCTFGEVLYRFEGAIPLGIRRRKGNVVLNPTDDTILEKEDQVLVLAEDDDTYSPEPHSLRKGVASENEKVRAPTELQRMHTVFRPNSYKKLLIGWRKDIMNLVQVLDKILLRGSELHILCEVSLSEREAFLTKHMEGNPNNVPKNLRLVQHVGNPRNRHDLEKMDLSSFSSVIVSNASTYTGSMSVEDRDSQAIVSLLLIQEVLKGMPRTDVVVVGEINDPRSRGMILQSQMADAIIATNDLISKSLAMVSEDSSVNRVLEDLFDAKGNEIQVVPANQYITPGEVLTFIEVQGRVRLNRSIALGFSRGRGQLTLNPEGKLTERKWEKGDRLITLSLSSWDSETGSATSSPLNDPADEELSC